MLLSDKPDIVIATPSRALALLQSKILSLSLLESLVIDEADLILSYGHDEDVRQIFSGGYLPKVFQSFLMSATMTEDVELLKGLILRNPVSCLPSSGFPILIAYLGNLETGRRRRWSSHAKPICRQVSRFFFPGLYFYLHLNLRCSEVDKFLLIYVVLKLKLIRGKCIIFVNDVDRCYRLKLFLEQFSIKSCVLNSELPLNSR